MPTPPVLRTRYTVAAGPGDSAAQAVPAASRGGYAASTAWAGGALGDLFNKASSIDVRDAHGDYRAVYVVNTGGGPATAVRAYLVPHTAGAALTAVGADPRPVTDLDSLAPQAVAVASAYAAPAGVAFFTPTAYTGGVALGDLPAGTGRALWLRRTPTGDAGAAYDRCDLVVEDGAGNALVRAVYWETEPYAEATAPLVYPAFVATPTPFRRVEVDFLTAGGARVTWRLDPTLTDAGPYAFQLQASQSGADNADDWVDVGPPAVDPPYLLDDTQRLWGMSSTLHYRVVLTTAARAYTSPAANVYGLLRQRDWLTARELVRKEELHLRAFTGAAGYLLKARRYGPRCACVDPDSNEVGNSSDPVCYGTGWVGGYHPPVPLYFANPSGAASRERQAVNDGRGSVRDETATGRMVAHLPVVARDVWVEVGSDDRHQVAEVRVKVAFAGVPLVYDVELRQLPRTDVAYKVPLVRPAAVTPYWAAPQAVTI